MEKYKPIEELISNENVLKVLNQAKLPGECSLLLEVIKESPESDIFKVYVTPKDYDSNKNDLIFLATVTKKKEKLNSWYVNLEGNWKVH